MKASLLKVIGFAAVVTLNALRYFTRAHRKVRMSEYTNAVEQGLYALNEEPKGVWLLQPQMGQ